MHTALLVSKKLTCNSLLLQHRPSRRDSTGKYVKIPVVSAETRRDQAKFLLEFVPRDLHEAFLLRENSNGATAIMQAASHGNLAVLRAWLPDPSVTSRVLLHKTGVQHIHVS